MIDGLTSYCDLNTAATAGIPNFALRLQDVKDKRVLIDGMNQLGGASTTGVTTDVRVLRALMISKAFKCASATLAFANSTNNNTLKALVNFTKAKLNKLANEDVDDVCQQIHDAADANTAGATPFGLVASDVTDLQAAVNLYRTKTGETRQAIVSKSQANKQAHNMIRELIDELLVGQMDKMVNTIEETENMFWSGYFQAREIIDPAAFTTVLKILVLNKANNAPLRSAKVYRDASGTFKRTTKLGFVTYKDIEEGPHNFIIKHKLFEDGALSNVMIASGKKHEATVLLNPTGTGSSLIFEGDVGPALIKNIPLPGLNPSPATMVIFEITGSTLKFYSSPNAGDPPAGVFYERAPGITTISIEEFSTLLGFGGANTKLNVQNTGGAEGHYKLTFTAVQ